MNEQMLKKAFWILLAVIFVYMLAVVPHYGISGDEVTQYRYGAFVWDYIKSFGANKAVLTDEYILKKELQYYGGFFDGFVTMLLSIFHPKDEFVFRHYWATLFGFTGIMATGLLAKEMKGWLAAIIAVIFLFFTTRYLGESFNNPKDPPFAATYALALYAMIVWLKNIEHLKWKHTILMGLAVALCLSIRIGGLLLVAYMGLFYAVTVWQKKLQKTKALGNSIKHLAVAGFIGYFGAILWWPYALEAPLSNPLEALRVMSTYPLFVKMLFEGHRIDTSMVPWYYLPKWLMMGLPLYLLAGFIGGIVMIRQLSKKYGATYLWMVVFAALFPVLYIIYKKSVLYDGLRHALFVIPPMVVVAAVFVSYLFETLPSKAMKYAVAGLTLVLVALPARFMFANHPNEYVYFNELAGGVKNAHGEYETDYYMNSIKQGYKWLVENELKKYLAKDTMVIATNCMEPLQQYQKVSPVAFHALYSRFYQKNQNDWDYAIYYGRFLDKEQLLNGYFPSSMAIHVIKVDGVPICAVLKNDPERNGFKGYTAMKQNDYPHAAEYFGKAAAKYPEDMEVWQSLTDANIRLNNVDGAQAAIDKAMAISSLDVQTAMMAGQIALYRKDFRKAVNIFSKITEENPDLDQAYQLLQQAQRGAQNPGLR
ncbi:MAG: tetratricopeptide repeat protein [Bacteroidota bacterium]